jgi:hypothetical protein
MKIWRCRYFTMFNSIFGPQKLAPFLYVALSQIANLPRGKAFVALASCF